MSAFENRPFLKGLGQKEPLLVSTLYVHNQSLLHLKSHEVFFLNIYNVQYFPSFASQLMFS